MAVPRGWDRYKVLDLWFGTNKLGNIEKDFFSGFVQDQERHIRTLSLTYNDIESIESGSFNRLADLQEGVTITSNNFWNDECYRLFWRAKIRAPPYPLDQAFLTE